eukprot:521055-Pleurochrysis_carterae.AAC.1
MRVHWNFINSSDAIELYLQNYVLQLSSLLVFYVQRNYVVDIHILCDPVKYLVGFSRKKFTPMWSPAISETGTASQRVRAVLMNPSAPTGVQRSSAAAKLGALGRGLAGE